VKTGHLPDLLLGHQNGQRNEATKRVNESGIQNRHPSGQVPQKLAERDFEQKVAEISKRKAGHYDRGALTGEPNNEPAPPL
jgi:hypothetical protein